MLKLTKRADDGMIAMRYLAAPAPNGSLINWLRHKRKANCTSSSPFTKKPLQKRECFFLQFQKQWFETLRKVEQ